MLIKHQTYSHFQLWQAQVGSDSLSLETETKAMLSQSELARLAKTTNKNKQREYLLSRSLIRHALRHIFKRPLEYWQLKERIHSLPVIENLPSPIFYSLTHSHGLVQFATSKLPIGIDIEKIKAKNNLLEIVKLSLCEPELAIFKGLIQSQKLPYFYQIWSTKEAYFKAQSTSVQEALSFSDCDIATVLIKQQYQYLDLSNSRYANIIVVDTKSY